MVLKPAISRYQAERQVELKRRAMQLVLTLPADAHEAEQILELALALMRGWIRDPTHGGWS